MSILHCYLKGTNCVNFTLLSQRDELCQFYIVISKGQTVSILHFTSIRDVYLSGSVENCNRVLKNNKIKVTYSTHAQNVFESLGLDSSKNLCLKNK